MLKRQPTIQSERRYMTGLDGLRAIAVIAVLFYHMNFPWASGGFLGVTLFFVLSGYLITDLLVVEWKRDRTIDFKRFWLRRARRLLPAMYVMVIAVTAWITLFDRQLVHTLKEDLLSVFFYFSNWWFIYKDVSYFETYDSPSLVTHFWSLAVEEQFYIIWPIIIFVLFFLFRKKQVVGFILFFLMAASTVWMGILYDPGEDPTRVYYGTDTRAFSLIVGALLAFVWPSRQLSSDVGKGAKALLDFVGFTSLILIIILMNAIDQFDPILYYGGMLLISGLMAIAIAVAAHPSSFFGKLLSIKPLEWVGLRSYGIYLWHYPIIMLVGSSYYNDGTWSWTVAFQIVLVLLFSDLSWKFIEDPIRRGRLKQWIFSIRKRQTTVMEALMSTRKHWQPLMLLFVIATYGLVGAEPYVKSAQVEEELEAALTEQFEQEQAARLEQQEKERAAREQEEQEILAKLYEEPIVFIGDSVALTAIPYLQELFPAGEIDVKIGRQFRAAPEIIEQLNAQGKLHDYVIFSLGTNGVFNEQTATSMIEQLGPERHIFFVNTRMPDHWQERVNGTLQKMAAQYEHVHLIDWYNLSSKYVDHFEPDLTHLKPSGGQKYAEMIAKALEEHALNR